jgi:SAM-dependent methyltransferase
MTSVVHYDFAELFVADEYLYFLEDTLREEDTEGQITFIESALGMTKGMRVVDLGCGHGRHTNEFARRGYSAIGIDLTAGFVDVARAEAAKEGLESQFVHADLRLFVAENTFDRAVCLFDVIGFFEDSDHEQILRNTWASLKPGGKLLLDIRTREFMVRLPPVSVTDKGNGDMMIDRVLFDIHSGRLIDKRSYVRGGKVREVRFSVRLYAFTEMKSMLERAGFEIEATFGGFDGSSLSIAKSRTLIIARRPERDESPGR